MTLLSQEAEDIADAAMVRSRTAWWRRTSLCRRFGGCFWRELEPDVHRCRFCKTTSFRNCTIEKLERWLLS